MRVYRKQKEKFFDAAAFCEFPDCYRRSVDVHHIKGRNGKLLNDMMHWTALCREHHDWIHAHPAEARAKGLLK